MAEESELTENFDGLSVFESLLTGKMGTGITSSSENGFEVINVPLNIPVSDFFSIGVNVPFIFATGKTAVGNSEVDLNLTLGTNYVVNLMVGETVLTGDPEVGVRSVTDLKRGQGLTLWAEEDFSVSLAYYKKEFGIEPEYQAYINAVTEKSWGMSFKFKTKSIEYTIGTSYQEKRLDGDQAYYESTCDPASCLNDGVFDLHTYDLSFSVFFKDWYTYVGVNIPVYTIAEGMAAPAREVSFSYGIILPFEFLQQKY